MTIGKQAAGERVDFDSLTSEFENTLGPCSLLLGHSLNNFISDGNDQDYFILARAD
jgi:hypothetical protein